MTTTITDASIYAEGMTTEEWDCACDKWRIAHPGYSLCWVYKDVVVVRLEPLGWLHKSGEWVDRNDEDSETWSRILDGCRIDTVAEAEFRLMLDTNPREALGPFLRATGGEYEGTCPDCNRRDRHGWSVFRCPTCHGTGGSPSRDLLQVARDWFGEGMEHDVLCDVISNSGE